LATGKNSEEQILFIRLKQWTISLFQFLFTLTTNINIK